MKTPRPGRHALKNTAASLAAVGLIAAQACAAPPPPLNFKAFSHFPQLEYENVGNLISLDSIAASIQQQGDQIGVDLSGLTKLQDNSDIVAADIYGKGYIGPYPFDAANSRLAYKRFGSSFKIKGGAATLPISDLFKPKENSEKWTDGGNLGVRLYLFLQQDGQDRSLGAYDTFVSFSKTGDKSFAKLTSIVEGPLLNGVSSDDPTSATISFRTDEPVVGKVTLGAGAIFQGATRTTDHHIAMTGLTANQAYSYTVSAGGTTTRPYNFKTAPPKGAADFRFAYLGDTRSGDGGGLQNLMGVNHEVMEKLIPKAYYGEAEFFLMGGDMITGYTTVTGDFLTQIRSWKQGMAGFWAERAVYTAVGNHEALLNTFDDKTADPTSAYGIGLDKWSKASNTYGLESSEAIFAAEFNFPRNGPADPTDGRPQYSENVYSFQYGSLKVIVFNNNYWVFSHSNKKAKWWEKYGGNPEGYIMDDQLQWIKQEISAGEKDATVKHMVLMAQEPVFPNSAHMSDAMWWNGDNSVRAWMFDPNGKPIWIGGGPVPADVKGVIDVRDELATAVAASAKVAAVLCSDEHVYHRTLIGPETPIGNLARDLKNGANNFNWPTNRVSPLDTLKRRTWYIVCVGGGAPYAGELESPWNEWWGDQKNPDWGYKFIPQENICLFDVAGDKLSLTVVSGNGEVIDRIDNLHASRDPSRPVQAPFTKN
jgi:hypothetical protein